VKESFLLLCCPGIHVVRGLGIRSRAWHPTKLAPTAVRASPSQALSATSHLLKLAANSHDLTISSGSQTHAAYAVTPLLLHEHTHKQTFLTVNVNPFLTFHPFLYLSTHNKDQKQDKNELA